MIYKNGVWEQASSVKVYENGEWVEKIASYDNMEITVLSSTGYTAFYENSENYVKCSANNIKCFFHLSSEEQSFVKFKLLPSGDNFGYNPKLELSYYMKSNGMVDSSTYSSKFVSLGYTFQETGYGAGGSIANKINQLESSAAKTFTVDYEDSSTYPVTELNITISINSTNGISTTSSVYIEINNIKLNGVPYGINQTITP